MNCIMVVIDSLDYTRCQQSSKELLPFLNACARHGIVCENMYSQAPYTEAAAMALYCGQNTLDRCGYMERYNNAETTLFEVFSNSGYDVFFNALQPQCFPSSLRRGITDIAYNRGFDILGLWIYRLQYYSKIYEENELTEQDIELLIRIMDDNFEEWLRFLCDLDNNDPSVRMIKPLNRYFNVSECKDKVEIEFNYYNNDKKNYILSVLKQKQKHRLFQIPYFRQIDYDLSRDVKEYYAKECSQLCEKIRKSNIISNTLFNADVYRQTYHMCVDYIKNRDKADFKVQKALIKNALVIHDFRARFGSECSGLKGQPSFRTHVDDFLSWIDRRTSGNKPYFACIHVDDIHFPEMFFTYDAKSKAVIEEDLALAQDYLSSRRRTAAGTISTDLSLLYADNQCRFLVEEIKKRGRYDDTIFFVTADHGFSYSGYPIRNKPINTFYLENFKIPFYIFGGDVKPLTATGLYSSVDIPSTICRVMGVDKPDSFVGRSIIDSNEEENILTIEYCGGGCPDILRRDLMIAAFDSKAMVAVKAKANKELSLEDIVEVYDLRNDPMQRRNLKHRFNFLEYKKYYAKIVSRLKEIEN